MLTPNYKVRNSIDSIIPKINQNITSQTRFLTQQIKELKQTICKHNNDQYTENSKRFEETIRFLKRKQTQLTKRNTLQSNLVAVTIDGDYTQVVQNITSLEKQISHLKQMNSQMHCDIIIQRDRREHEIAEQQKLNSQLKNDIQNYKHKIQKLNRQLLQTKRQRQMQKQQMRMQISMEKQRFKSLKKMFMKKDSENSLKLQRHEVNTDKIFSIIERSITKELFHFKNSQQVSKQQSKLRYSSKNPESIVMIIENALVQYHQVCKQLKDQSDTIQKVFNNVLKVFSFSSQKKDCSKSKEDLQLQNDNVQQIKAEQKLYLSQKQIKSQKCQKTRKQTSEISPTLKLIINSINEQISQLRNSKPQQKQESDKENDSPIQTSLTKLKSIHKLATQILNEENQFQARKTQSIVELERQLEIERQSLKNQMTKNTQNCKEIEFLKEKFQHVFGMFQDVAFMNIDFKKQASSTEITQHNTTLNHSSRYQQSSRSLSQSQKVFSPIPQKQSSRPRITKVVREKNSVKKSTKRNKQDVTGEGKNQPKNPGDEWNDVLEDY